MQINFWTGSKKFEPAQKLLGPVEGQGIINLCKSGSEQKKN